MGLCNSLVAACFAFLPEVGKKASENTQKIFLFSFHNKTCDVNPFTLKTLAACSENSVHLGFSVQPKVAFTEKWKPFL